MRDAEAMRKTTSAMGCFGHRWRKAITGRGVYARTGRPVAQPGIGSCYEPQPPHADKVLYMGAMGRSGLPDRTPRYHETGIGSRSPSDTGDRYRGRVPGGGVGTVNPRQDRDRVRVRQPELAG